MDDKEYKETSYTCVAMLISFVLFPAFCFITIIFGYEWNAFIITESILAALIIPCFILRTKFLLKYRQYTSKRRFLFETIAYIACLVFALGTGFAVHENDGVFSYYLLNIYIQPAYMIFVLVVMGYHVATAKKAAKASIAEDKLRKNVYYKTQKPSDSDSND